MPAKSPPKWAARFLQWYCNPDLLEHIEGDVLELYDRTLKRKNKVTADFLFVWNVVRFFRWSNIRRSQSHSTTFTMMYKNYFAVFKRNFVRQKGYSMLNTFGLAIGISCFIFITLYIRDEYSFDRMHSKADRIYRIHEIFEADGVGERSASQPFPVATAIMNDYAGQVEEAVRFFNFQAPTLALATADGKKEFNEPRLFFTEPSVFKIFDFEFVKGDPSTALSDSHTIVITEAMAKKYFGEQDPLGKYLKFQGKTNLLVTAVLKDIPENTHFQFDFLVSFYTLHEFYDGQLPEGWYWNPCWTYLLMKNQYAAADIQTKLPAFVEKYFPEFIRKDVTLELMPLTDIHLKSNMDYEIQANSSETTVFVFASIAGFVLLIACINFINLSTARASRRAKEVGMRKTLGSKKSLLVMQFLFESILLCVISFAVAVLIVIVALPAFNMLSEKQIGIRELTDPFYLVILTVLPMVIGFIAGVYPAFVLSSFKPITALKSNYSPDRGVSFRKALVVVQFSLSIILLIGTGVAIDQLNMLRNSDPGFDKENVVMIPVSRSPIAETFESLKTEFLRNPNVQQVTAVEEIIGSKHQVGNYFFEGLEKSQPYPRINVRHDFIKTFDIPLVAGRDYSEDVVTDDTLALLVNEQLVKQMGWPSNEAAIGKSFSRFPNRKIVGVVKDFNFTSKHQPIRPLVMDLNMNPRAFDLFLKYVAVKIKTEDMTTTLSWMQEQWKAQMPGWPFEYFFLESNLANLYKSEQKMSRVTLIFSGLSILVACLGLFGLSTFTAEQRRKEMSIRKVLGSTDSEVFMLFSKQFFMLVIIANVVAFPVAWYVMKQWLSTFAYQVEIEPAFFAIGAVAALLVAFITISYQAIKTSRTNPAEVLRTE